MFRELMIQLYLFIFMCLFNILKIFPVKSRTVHVVTFPENSLYVYKAQKDLDQMNEIIFLKDKKIDITLLDTVNCPIFNYNSLNPTDFIKSIFFLATSKVILVDNYYGFLAVTKFKPGVEVIQLWHAAGAIKRFGLQDHSVKNRKQAAKERFIKVYKNFDKIVVGSDKMAEIFTSSFNATPKKFLKTGIPRIDLFFDQERYKIKSEIAERYDLNKNKQIILYAPTYRDYDRSSKNIKMDFEKVYQNLKDEYIFLVKLHPAMKNTFSEIQKTYSGFFQDCSEYPYINHLFLVTDILVTDYSSLPQEFALMNKPILFFAYDFEEYAKKRGLYEEFMWDLPGNITYNTKDLVEEILHPSNYYDKLKQYAEVWNKYSDGYSSRRLAEYIHNYLNDKETQENENKLQHDIYQ